MNLFIHFKYDLIQQRWNGQICFFLRKYENYQKVRHEEAKFYGISKHPQDFPDFRMFKSVIDRFLGPGSVHKKVAGAHEGACEHVAVQPAPGQGEEGGGEPSGQVESRAD